MKSKHVASVYNDAVITKALSLLDSDGLYSKSCAAKLQHHHHGSSYSRPNGRWWASLPCKFVSAEESFSISYMYM